MRWFFILLFARLLSGAEYTVDTQRSTIFFEATKLAFIGVEGSFKAKSGFLVFNNEMPEGIHGVVDAISVNTDNEKRDAQLRSSDFFDAVRYPQIVFTMSRRNVDTMDARVTIKAITKTVVFRIEKVVVEGTHALIELSGTLRRSDFDLDNSMLEAVIKDEVRVRARIVADQ